MIQDIAVPPCLKEGDRALIAFKVAPIGPLGVGLFECKVIEVLANTEEFKAPSCFASKTSLSKVGLKALCS
ncbi:hypothetical protein LB347_14230, partial [Staphylococcus aureus]|nr:hypothetical protein [Staphylococcus aureus]